MPATKPTKRNSEGSNTPCATTLNFCPVVSGGTLSASSSVRKLGSAKKRRSLEVPLLLSSGVLACGASGGGACCGVVFGGGVVLGCAAVFGGGVVFEGGVGFGC